MIDSTGPQSSSSSSPSSTAAAAASRAVVDHHYKSHTSSSYENAFFYSPGEYNDWLCEMVVDALFVATAISSPTSTNGGGGGRGMDAPDTNGKDDNSTRIRGGRMRRGRGAGSGIGSGRLVLLDVGGGTGNFTASIVERVGRDRLEAIVVDPFLPPTTTSSISIGGRGMGDVVDSDDVPSVRFVRASARDFIPDGAAGRANDHDDDDDDNNEEKAVNSRPGSKTKPFWKSGYDRVLLKEVVHHLDPDERIGIFIGLRNGFASSMNDDYIANRVHDDGVDDEEKKDPGGDGVRHSAARLRDEGRREGGADDDDDDNDESCDGGGVGASLLIVTRPKYGIDYPLWPEARDVWAIHQMGSRELEDDLVAAGYKDVTCKTMTYPCAVRLDTWLSMVKNRFWSTFSHFTDVELEDGCARIVEEAMIDGNGRVHFEERLLFISACIKN
ncbi:hypothetical protein ACHAXA_007691 [Cyclostephanos tholiformis]|uniref:Methyltransferase n=1 Tax=Cyclostephanos tholiformis TaxID=382380 RepID=A0ABD3R0I8_9STRA